MRCVLCRNVTDVAVLSDLGDVGEAFEMGRVDWLVESGGHDER